MMPTDKPTVHAYVHASDGRYAFDLEAHPNGYEYLRIGDCCVILDAEGLERLRAAISDHLGTKAASELRAEAEAKSARAA